MVDVDAEAGTAPRDLALAVEACADQAAQLLKALANGQRLRVLCLLFDNEMSVGEINARVALSQSALSQHLAVLREEGLVNTRRESQTIHYSLADGPARQIIRALHEVYCTAHPERPAGPAERDA